MRQEINNYSPQRRKGHKEKKTGHREKQNIE